MYDFNKKVVLVTGGGSGIGRATAHLFAMHGAVVIVSDVNAKAGNETVSEINNSGRKSIYIEADVSKADACENLVAKTIEKYGRIDVAFNNAGISGESNAIADLSVEGWDHIIAVNLNSVFYCMKYELQQMLKQGSGSIINMSSILGQVGFANAAGYVAAKHGVVGLTKNAALEYASKGIRVNAVGPAFIYTPLLDNLSSEMKDALVPLHPAGRFGEPKEVAELVLWLASDKASFINGSYYPIDGGYLAK